MGNCNNLRELLIKEGFGVYNCAGMAGFQKWAERYSYQGDQKEEMDSFIAYLKKRNLKSSTCFFSLGEYVFDYFDKERTNN